MTIASSDTAVVRRLSDSLARGDVATLKDCLAEDAAWHLPLAGDDAGRAAIVRILGSLRPLSGGTFMAVLNVLVGDSHVVALQHATGAPDDKKLDLLACQLISVEDGKIASMLGFYSDQYALDAFGHNSIRSNSVRHGLPPTLPSSRITGASVAGQSRLG